MNPNEAYVALWESAWHERLAPEVDALLAELFPEEES